MASTRAAATAVALASLLLLLVVAIAAVTGAGADDATAAGEPDPDAARASRRILDCTMRCVTEAMGCATRCAGARADEAPVCAAACVQGDIGCLAGCGLRQPAPGSPHRSRRQQPSEQRDPTTTPCRACIDRRPCCGRASCHDFHGVPAVGLLDACLLTRPTHQL
ncbi:hypothetical protein PVAP13_7NG148400 [Panicum virgatum]|uniref:Uncharacterized protein n=1 Tax=Panicum virgatum TaxID=38727 RepID=A0A8T0PTY4_PANVG|nr:hypothetical protein PVAP13_7NG148400 [Panicum virgatum]